MKKRSTCTHIHGSVYTDLKSEKNSKGKRFLKRGTFNIQNFAYV